MKNIIKVSLLEICLLILVVNCQSNAGNSTKITEETENSVELKGLKKAYFASGCFWCVEAIFESLEGVKEAVSGYSGGKETNPTYQEVASHRTGHAEAVEVFYDPALISYETLVEVFYDSQDPTTVGQNPDFGQSYRSIIFYTNAREKEIAEAYKEKLSKSGQFDKPIVTEIIPLVKFWRAEDYHQNYERLNPNQPYVRAVSIPRLNRFKAKHPELLKKKAH